MGTDIAVIWPGETTKFRGRECRLDDPYDRESTTFETLKASESRDLIGISGEMTNWLYHQ